MTALPALALVLSTVAAQYLREDLPVLVEPPRYHEDDVSQVARLATLVEAQEPRLIEPTSPVLGRALSARIRQDPRHPTEILAAIERDFPSWRRATAIGALAYARTLLAAIEEERPEPTTLTVVEHGAIPLEVLAPHHARYAHAVRVLAAQSAWSNVDDAKLLDAAAKTARALREERQAKARVGPARGLATVVSTFCPGACGELVDLNLKIASTEDSFPRVQYSINGFTGFVFAELLAHPRLHELLRTVFDAEASWLADAAAEKRPVRAIVEHTIAVAQESGFRARDAILVLAFSTRNMPSVDFQYASDPERALALEVYFWKFRQMRDVIARTYLGDLTSVHRFDVNPGIYHFTTATLHACEIEDAGFPGVLGILVATGAKVAYKTHKLVYGIEGAELVGDPIFYLPSLAKQQGYFTGVEAGFYGGVIGVEHCAEKK